MACRFYRRPEEEWHPDSHREILYDALHYSDPDFDEDGVAGNRLDIDELWCSPSDLLDRMSAIEERADQESVCIPLLSAFRGREYKCRRAWPTAYAFMGEGNDDCGIRTLEVWFDYPSGGNCITPERLAEIRRVGLAYALDYTYEDADGYDCSLDVLHVIYHTKDGDVGNLDIRM